jgi:hypothetical protein
MAKKAATLLGILLLIVGVAGFLAPRPLGAHLTPMHNGIHLVTGAASLGFGLWGSLAAARTFSFVFGLVYGLLGVAGFVFGVPDGGADPSRMLRLIPGHLELGMADHAIHVALGTAYVAAALATRLHVADEHTGIGAGHPPAAHSH